MAENQGGGSEDRDTDDLSEQESPHRVEDMRKKGQVSQSREINALVAFMGAAVTLYVMGPSMADRMVDLLRDFMNVKQAVVADFTKEGVLSTIMFKSLKTALWILIPVGLGGFIFGVLSSFSQIGSVLSMDPLTPSFDKINPISGTKRLFAKKHLISSGMLVLKAIATVAAAYVVIKRQAISAGHWVEVDPSVQLYALGQLSKEVAIPIVTILAAFAGIDYWTNKSEFSKQVRLTKQEAKQEHKEHEGDPQIKARVRAVQRESARKRMMQAVKKADVIITNPTHIAIAIVYNKDKMAAPTVVAKGADFLAQRIKKIAAEAGVPLVENVPLARTLYKSVKVGQGIPRALYQAVAEVLAYVYRLKNRTL